MNFELALEPKYFLNSVYLSSLAKCGAFHCSGKCFENLYQSDASLNVKHGEAAH